MGKRRVQLRLNNRIFAIEVEDSFENETLDLTNPEHISYVYEVLAEKINLNNEKESIIFYEEILVCCSECGISLQEEYEKQDGTCANCAEDKNGNV